MVAVVQPPTERQLLSRAEVATATGLSISSVTRMIHDGQLASVKLRGRRLVPVSELTRLRSGGGQ